MRHGAWSAERKVAVALAGFLSLCLSLSAQQTRDPKAENLKPETLKTESTAAGADIFALNRSHLRIPSLALSDRQPFSFSEPVSSPLFFNWMETTPDFLPAFASVTPNRGSTRNTATERRGYSKDVVNSKEAVDVRSNLFDYAGGEVGFLYGRSTGKYGRDYMQGYIFGEVGDDKFHISVGASYEESNGRGPRIQR